MAARKNTKTTKTAAKPKTAKRSAKPKTAKPKTTAKRKTAPKPKTATAKPKRETVTVKLASGRKIERPKTAYQFGHGGSVANGERQRAAEIASALACTDGSGAPLNRARIGTVQIAEVAKTARLSKPTQTAVSKSVGLDWRELVGYADGRIGRGEVDTAGIAALAAKTVPNRADKKTLAQRKINGRALAAALVGLAVASGGKLPTGNGAPSAPVRETVKRK